MGDSENESVEAPVHPVPSTPAPQRVQLISASVNIKVPEFIPGDPEFWLAQLEAQFATARVTSERTKFHYLVAAIPASMAPDVRDIVIHPPDHKPFTALRDAILRRTAMSEEKRIHQLLEGTQLDGRTPSQLLRLMRQRAGDAISEAVLRQLWLKRLPDTIQSVISIFHDQSSLDKLAEGADRAMEIQGFAVQHITTDASTSLSEVQKQLQNLSVAVNELRADRHQRRNSRSHSRGRQPANSQEGDLCWYHRTYKDKARKCLSPCRLSGKFHARGN